VLRDFLGTQRSHSHTPDRKGGFLITQSGDTEKFDLTTIAALASGAYLANQTIAGPGARGKFQHVSQGVNQQVTKISAC